jgi:hypothetical protein
MGMARNKYRNLDMDTATDTVRNTEMGMDMSWKLIWTGA